MCLFIQLFFFFVLIADLYNYMPSAVKGYGNSIKYSNQIENNGDYLSLLKQCLTVKRKKKSLVNSVNY